MSQFFFVNDREEKLKVYEVDENGANISRGIINGNANRIIDVYAGQVLVVSLFESEEMIFAYQVPEDVSMHSRVSVIWDSEGQFNVSMLTDEFVVLQVLDHDHDLMEDFKADMSEYKSKTWGHDITVSFNNTHNRSVTIHSVDSEGQRSYFCTLAPNQAHTFEQHTGIYYILSTVTEDRTHLLGCIFVFKKTPVGTKVDFLIDRCGTVFCENKTLPATTENDTVKPEPLVEFHDYNCRSRYQILRAFCVYMGIPYTDKLYTEKQMADLMSREIGDYELEDVEKILPYIEDRRQDEVTLKRYNDEYEAIENVHGLEFVDDNRYLFDKELTEIAQYLFIGGVENASQKYDILKGKASDNNVQRLTEKEQLVTEFLKSMLDTEFEYSNSRTGEKDMFAEQLQQWCHNESEEAVLRIVSEHLGNNNWLINNEISFWDFMLWELVNRLTEIQRLGVHHGPSRYRNLLLHNDRVNELEKIAEWRKSEGYIRGPFNYPCAYWGTD